MFLKRAFWQAHVRLKNARFRQSKFRPRGFSDYPWASFREATKQRIQVGCKISRPFFSRKPPALTSISRGILATNPEIASVNVLCSAIFPPSAWGSHCPSFKLAPKKRLFGAIPGQGIQHLFQGSDNGGCQRWFELCPEISPQPPFNLNVTPFYLTFTSFDGRLSFYRYWCWRVGEQHCKN